MAKGISRLACVAMCLAILHAVSPTLLSGQSGCSAQDSRDQLPPSDPAYLDAVDFARTLTERGLAVQCILGSKWWNLFEDQEGAAYYRTVQGDFDVFVHAESRKFRSPQDDRTPQEKRAHLLVLFSGNPTRIRTRLLDGPEIMYFIKQGNALVFAWRNKQLAAGLNATLIN